MARARASWRTVPIGLAGLALAAFAAGAPAQQGEDAGEVAQAAEVAAAAPAVLDPAAPAGAELTRRIDRAFDRYLLPVGTDAQGAARTRALEGRVIRSAWRLADSEATTAAVMAGYRERIDRLGYAPLFACVTEACGGIDFRFAIELLPAPDMLVDAADFAQLSARREAAAGASYVSVLVSRLLGAVYVQTVAVAVAEDGQRGGQGGGQGGGQEGGQEGDDAGGTPRAAAPAAGAGAGATSSLLERLLAFGHVRLESIAFETGSVALTADSGEALDRAAQALAARPELGLLVVGHSDNRGPLADNVTLSRRRAEAVREALIARGIDAARLEAHGVGFLSPVASNATAAGRALNRRVELVLR
ncbi:MAG TPA: OmpA family protein [Thermohalobaculum sp.]|nr:OmpA family protein [Thermohalobaculum sp.]